MFVVFDCSRSFGYAHRTRFAWKARLVSRLLTRSTGRFHDWDAFGRYLLASGNA